MSVLKLPTPRQASIHDLRIKILARHPGSDQDPGAMSSIRDEEVRAGPVFSTRI